jgi:hypothetical protein
MFKAISKSGGETCEGIGNTHFINIIELAVGMAVTC